MMGKKEEVEEGSLFLMILMEIIYLLFLLSCLFLLWQYVAVGFRFLVLAKFQILSMTIAMAAGSTMVHCTPKIGSP